MIQTVLFTCSSVEHTAYSCDRMALVSAVDNSSQYFMGARLVSPQEGVKRAVRLATKGDSRTAL